MSKENNKAFHYDGIVIEALRSGVFKVKLDNSHEVLATASGKMRSSKIRILLHDRVTVEVMPNSFNKDNVFQGRIIRRIKI